MRSYSNLNPLATRMLTPHASAVLLDSEFGLDAFAERDASCGLLTTYEMDGYESRDRTDVSR